MVLRKNAGLDLRGLELVGVIGAWLAGILLESWASLPAFALLAGACAALLFIIPLWSDNSARLIMFMILALLSGAWRYASASPVGDPQAISAYIGPVKWEVRGTVTDEPKVVRRSRVLLIAVDSVSKNGGNSWQEAHGQLEVETLSGEIEDPYGPNYGDNVELQGKLQTPTSHSSPGVFASMAFPRICGLWNCNRAVAVVFWSSLLEAVSKSLAFYSIRPFSLTSWSECSRGPHIPGGVCWSLVLSSDPSIKSRTSKPTVHFIQGRVCCLV